MPDPAAKELVTKIVGRYALCDEIASGGMATVHIGRLLGAAGFSRTVAIKRLHPQFAKDPDFVEMFVDEARLAARVRHPNVVPTLDVVQTEGELFLVMEYVQGESLSHLARHARRSGKLLELPMVVTILVGVLHGLHAAHTARGERGEPLAIVHRDVSPHNVLVGVDGVSRVFDFGVAKARGRLQTTREGQIKGKLAYMAPEQLRGETVGPSTDVYAAGVVLWEACTGRRLFNAETEVALLKQVLDARVEPPSTLRSELPESLDAIVMKALATDPSERYASAREMALALEQTGLGASATELAEWVEDRAAATLADRAARVAEIESKSEILELADERSVSDRKSRLSLAGAGEGDGEAAGEGPGGEAPGGEAPGTSAGVVTAADARLLRPRSPSPPSRRPQLLAAVGLLLLGGLGAALLFGRGDAAVAPEAEPATTSGPTSVDGKAPMDAPAAAPSSETTAPPPTDSAPTDSAPADSAPADSAPAASVESLPSASVAPSAARNTPATPKTPVPVRPPPVAPPPTADPCANPFYVDPSGIKRIKPQCR